MQAFLRAVICGLIVVLLGAGVSPPASAASIFIVRGNLHYASGKPVPAVSMMVTSTSGTSRLDVHVQTDARGNFAAQSYGNFTITIDNGFNPCLSHTPTITGVAPQTAPLQLVAPNPTSVVVNLRSSDGSPVAGAQVSKLPTDFADGWMCSSGSATFSDENGVAVISTFEGATLKRYRNPVTFNPEPNRAPEYTALANVVYSPFEGVQLVRDISEAEFNSRRVNVVFDDIPSVAVSLPATTSSRSTFGVSATMKNPDGSISTASFHTSAMSLTAARLQFRSVDLYRRVASGSKWKPWTKVARVSVGANGKIAFSKLKWPKGTYQVQIRGVGFSLGSKIKSTRIK